MGTFRTCTARVSVLFARASWYSCYQAFVRMCCSRRALGFHLGPSRRVFTQSFTPPEDSETSQPRLVAMADARHGKFAHLRTPAMPPSGMVHYNQQMGGGWSIKLMTFGLFVGTGWFAYQLHERGRLPWQHNEKVRNTRGVAHGTVDTRPLESRFSGARVVGQGWHPHKANVTRDGSHTHTAVLCVPRIIDRTAVTGSVACCARHASARRHGIGM